MGKTVKTREILTIIRSIKKEANRKINILIVGEKTAGKKTLINALSKENLSNDVFYSVDMENQHVGYHKDFENRGKKADVIIFILDATKRINSNFSSYFEFTRKKLKKNSLILLNKIDLNPKIESLLYDIYQGVKVKPTDVISISARNNSKDGNAKWNNWNCYYHTRNGYAYTYSQSD